jgi:group I intron endonuclease
MNVSGIYKIINRTNGKYYVGSSNDIVGNRGRWSEHIQALDSNRHCNAHLQRSWKKYGKSNFDFVLVEEVPVNLLLLTEQKYLNIAESEKDKSYNAVFIPKGGGFIGKHHSEETKKRIAEKLKGRPCPTKGVKQSAERISHRIKYIIGEKNTSWKKVGEEAKKLIFDEYKEFGYEKSLEKARLLGFGSSVFQRLMNEFRKDGCYKKRRIY